MNHTITTSELKELINNQAEFMLIDVRNKDELGYGMIPTAHNIPLPEFEQALELDEKTFEEKYGFSKPKQDILLVVHCRTGGRSEVAAKIALQKGFNVKNYAGSVAAWSKIDSNVKMY